MKRLRSIDELPDYLQAVVQSGAAKSTGLLCPECQGGRTRERSLGVYRIDNEVVFKCYRAKCPYSAKLLLSGDAPPIKSGFEPNPYKEPMRLLSHGAQAHMRYRYGLKWETLEEFGVLEVQGIRALYLPVYGPAGSARGGVVRRFDGWGMKADAYKTADEPWIAWYRQRSGVPRGTVIVEDQLSAMRCWQIGYDSIALLGYEMSMDKAAEIVRYAVTPRKLALDADAFSEACHMAKRYSWIDSVVMLQADIKDITNQEIETRLNG